MNLPGFGVGFGGMLLLIATPAAIEDSFQTDDKMIKH